MQIHDDRGVTFEGPGRCFICLLFEQGAPGLGDLSGAITSCQCCASLRIQGQP